MIDWNHLPDPADRRGLCVLQGELGDDRLQRIVDEVCSDCSEPWERQIELSLALEEHWHEYLAGLQRRHGSDGLRKLELTESPDWHRIAAYLIESTQLFQRLPRKPAPLLDIGATIVDWLRRR